MVLNNRNKSNSILFEVLTSVFTVSSNFPDNPRIYKKSKYKKESEIYKQKLEI